jgi:hypothetical protein
MQHKHLVIVAPFYCAVCDLIFIQAPIFSDIISAAFVICIYEIIAHTTRPRLSLFIIALVTLRWGVIALISH